MSGVRRLKRNCQINADNRTEAMLHIEGYTS